MCTGFVTCITKHEFLYMHSLAPLVSIKIALPCLIFVILNISTCTKCFTNQIQPVLYKTIFLILRTIPDNCPYVYYYGFLFHLNKRLPSDFQRKFYVLRLAKRLIKI